MNDKGRYGNHKTPPRVAIALEVREAVARYRKGRPLSFQWWPPILPKAQSEQEAPPHDPPPPHDPGNPTRR